MATKKKTYPKIFEWCGHTLKWRPKTKTYTLKVRGVGLGLIPPAACGEWRGVIEVPGHTLNAWGDSPAQAMSNCYRKLQKMLKDEERDIEIRYKHVFKLRSYIDRLGGG